MAQKTKKELLDMILDRTRLIATNEQLLDMITKKELKGYNSPDVIKNIKNATNLIKEFNDEYIAQLLRGDYIE